MGRGAVYPQNTVQLLDPTPFCFAEPAFESSEDDSVRNLGLPVGLRMLDRGEVLLGAELGDEVLETLIGELHPVVGDERLWYLELGKYVSLVKTQDIGKNRTLQESSRAMIHAKKLLYDFWAEAMNNACYIHNIVTLRKGTSATLYEI